MENNEFRGMNDGIILYVLKSGDRHTDELKEIINSLFFEIKVGTLYSVITRLKNQKYIDEYRSSSDGSRRKFFTITKSGSEFFEKEYSEKFIYAPQIEERLVKVIEEPVVKEPKQPKDKKVDEYEDYVKSVQNNDYVETINEIDFSKITDFENFNLNEAPATNVENDVKEEVREVFIEEPVEIKPSVNPYMPIYNNTDVEQPKPEIDYDSVNNTSFEYKSVLNDLFPKRNSVEQSFNVYKPYESNNTYVEEPVAPTVTEIKSADFDDIYTYAEKDGISIRTSSDTNRYQGSKILNNLLRFHTSILWYVLIILEYLLLNLFFSGSVSFNGSVFGKVCLFTAVVPIISLIIYLTNTRYSVKDLPRFRDVIEITLIIAISAIIITIALSAINEVNYKEISELYYNVFVPCLIAINAPVFIIIKYFLSNLEFYQTI